MNKRDENLESSVYHIIAAMAAATVLAVALILCCDANAATRTASYAKQSSSGAPLIVAGRIDTAAVRLLAQFDDVTLELTPWAQNVDGTPRADVPLLLRRLNPNIRLWLYVLAGDQWLPPTFRPQATDRSGFRDVFDAVNSGNGWLYDTDGSQWMPDGQANYRLNLADYWTVWKMGDVYVRQVKSHLWDGVFLDCAHTSIAWTSRPNRPLDVERAGFRSLAAMDSARLVNVELLIRRLHAAHPCLLVALNGTGPKPAGLDVDFREGIDNGLVTPAEAAAWLRTPGTHWAMSSCYGDADCAYKARLLRGLSTYGRSVIVSLGPDRAWPPLETR